MKNILLKSLPLVLSANFYACTDEYLKPAPADDGIGGSAGNSSIGGSGGIDDCIGNNPGPDIDSAVIYHYPVEGKDVSKVVDSLLDLGDGRISASNTTCVLSFLIEKEIESEYQISETPYNFCTKIWVTNVETFYDATVRLPQWEGCDSCWDSYLNVLGEHEQGHVNICSDAASYLEEQVSDASAYFCLKAAKEVVEEIALEYFHRDLLLRADRAYSEFQEADQEYDQNSRHDLVQNSVLDCE